MSLKGSTVLVLGATGNVGHGIARAAGNTGAALILPSRSKERARMLRSEFPDAHVIIADISDGVGADALAAELRQRFASVDHVVASLGAWWQRGALVEQPADEYEEVRRMLLDSHVHAARTLLPLAAPTGSYTVITGAGAVRPMQGASLLTIALGGTLALSRVLRFEHRHAVRVNELRIASRVEKVKRPGVVLAEDLGTCVVELMNSSVRGAVVPFESPASFRVDARIDDA